MCLSTALRSLQFTCRNTFQPSLHITGQNLERLLECNNIYTDLVSRFRRGRSAMNKGWAAKNPMPNWTFRQFVHYLSITRHIIPSWVRWRIPCLATDYNAQFTTIWPIEKSICVFQQEPPTQFRRRDMFCKEISGDQCFATSSLWISKTNFQETCKHHNMITMPLLEFLARFRPDQTFCNRRTYKDLQEWKLVTSQRNPSYMHLRAEVSIRWGIFYLLLIMARKW